MKYPKLVPDRICQTDITVVIYGEGVSETGSPIIVSNEELKCNSEFESYNESDLPGFVKTEAEMRCIERAKFIF